MSLLLTILKKPPKKPDSASPPGPASDALLMETGEYVLLETGDYILLE